MHNLAFSSNYSGKALVREHTDVEVQANELLPNFFISGYLLLLYCHLSLYLLDYEENERILL